MEKEDVMKIDDYGQWVSAETNDEFYTKELHSIKNYEYAPYFEGFLSVNSEGIFSRLGFGSSKINEFTVTAIAQSYAEYMKKNLGDEELIIVGHDNSFNTPFLAEVFAKVIRNTKAKVVLYDENKKISLPLLSYLTRRLKAIGGIYFTKSNDQNEQVHIRIIGENGFEVPFKTYEHINESATVLNPFSIHKSNKEVGFISKDILDKYYEHLLSGLKRTTDSKIINVHVSQMHSSASEVVSPLLSKMNVVHKMSNHPLSKKDLLFDVRNKKHLTHSIFDAQRQGADVIYSLSNDGAGLSIMAKDKKKFRLLNHSDISALLANYIITQARKNEALSNDNFVNRTEFSSSITAQIALANNIRINDLLPNDCKGLLLSINRRNAIITDDEIPAMHDAMQTIALFTEMANYYKSQRVSVFEKLNQIHKQYGMHRLVVKTIDLKNEYHSELLKEIRKQDTLGEQKYEIVSESNSNNNKGYLSITGEFSNKSQFTLKSREQKLDIIVEAISDSATELVDIIMLEMDVFNFVEDLKKVDSAVTFHKKDIYKFSFFAIFLGLIIWVLFDFIYKSTSSASVANISKTIFDQNNRYLWLTVIVWWFFTFVIKAFARQRMLSRLGEKIPFYRQLLALLMSPIIDLITPFTFGGDLAGYWFLRKYGVKRESLISTYFSNTIWFQLRLIIQMLILLPFGYSIYNQLLNTSSWSTTISLAMVIIGFSWCFITSTFIFSMMISKKFQESVLSLLIFLFELLPFVNVIMLEPKIAKIQYEFQKIRKSASVIWFNPLSLLETFIYTIGPLFFVPQFFIISKSGMINQDITANSYLAQLIVENIGKSANSLSITPGGIGSAEFLQMNVSKWLYDNSLFISNNPALVGATNTGHGFAIASGVDLLNKMLLTLPFTVGSLIMIGGAWAIWDKRIKNKIKVENNQMEQKDSMKKMQNLYYWISSIWIAFFITLVILFVKL